MKKTTIILLKIVILMFSSSANADIRGGFSKQRLGLIFLTLLEEYYVNEPLALHLTDLPIEVEDGDVQKTPLVPLLNILTQEDFLSVKSIVKTMSINTGASLTTKVTLYDAVNGSNSIKAELGQVEIVEIKSISSVGSEGSEDVQQRFDVTFQWTLQNEAEWIWAKELASIRSFSLLRQATENAQLGTAKFKFRDEKWQLVEPPAIFSD